MSDIIKHGKCIKCKRLLGLTELVVNESGPGFVCIDMEACKNEVINNHKKLRKIHKG